MGRAAHCLAQQRLLARGLERARLPERAAIGLRAVHAAVWLGVLDDDDLRDLDERFYAGETLYTADAWNEQGLFRWEHDAVHAHVPAGGRVLVAACGGGREVLALLRCGFDARGEEPHPALAAHAEAFLARRGHPGRVRRAPWSGFAPREDGEAPVDGLVVGWGALSLLRGRAGRAAFLREARVRLAPGGMLLASGFDVAAEGRRLRWAAALASAVRLARRAAPVEPGDVLAPNLVHVFTPDRLSAELRGAGFELAEHRVIGEAEGGVRYAAVVARTLP